MEACTPEQHTMPVGPPLLHLRELLQCFALILVPMLDQAMEPKNLLVEMEHFFLSLLTAALSKMQTHHSRGIPA
jgi:hypothetical protein